MFPARKTHCRGGFDIRPGRSRRRGGCGTMRASSPTGGCYIAGFEVSRLAADLAVVRRGGIYPSRGRSRRRGVRRDEGIPPYGRFIGSAYTGKAACFRREERHVGGGFHIRPGRLRRRGPGRYGIGPYRGLLYRGVRGFPVGRGPAVGRRGGIYPSRGCLRRRRPGRYGIGPYRGLFYCRVPGWPRASSQL